MTFRQFAENWARFHDPRYYAMRDRALSAERRVEILEAALEGEIAHRQILETEVEFSSGMRAAQQAQEETQSGMWDQ